MGMKYDVWSGTSLVKLVEVVNDAIENGWVPLGGVAADANGWYQAMTWGPSPPAKSKKCRGCARVFDLPAGVHVPAHSVASPVDGCLVTCSGSYNRPEEAK